MRHRADTEHGFSLIEVLIASGILAAAAVALSGLCVLSVEALLAARQRSVAAILATARLEELLADPDALRDGVDGSDWVGPSGMGQPDAGGGYQRHWRVTASPTLPEKLVVVSVRVTSATEARLHLDDVRLITVAERPR